LRVLIVVTHLLGTGHLARALTLARAYRDAGHAVRLVSGGLPAAHLDARGLDLVQLPPIRSDGTAFTRLLDAGGSPADDALMATRTRVLTDTLHDHAPDILLTELFPFGRRILAGEFTALLKAARALPRRPVTLASVRDILAPPSKPAKAARTEALIHAHYDGVLVHADPSVTRLEQSWPVSDSLAPRLSYTGYVAPPPPGPHPDGAGQGEVLVSAGGGTVGRALYLAAIEAARLTPELCWHLLVGGGAALDDLKARAKGTATRIEPARPDFRAMLTHAAASVSMCGYNTALDLLQTGAPAVLVPFDADGETEQTARAGSLARLAAMRIVTDAALTPARLAEAVGAVIAEGRRNGTDLRFDGAAETVRLSVAMTTARR
jgi:predicted glycosyltransferase